MNALHTAAGSETSLTDRVTYLKSLNSVEKQYYSEMIKVVKLILVLLATNAVSEKLQCVVQVEDLATYNSTASLTELVYDTARPKDRTDDLPMCSVAKEFVVRNESQIRIFEHF